MVASYVPEVGEIIWVDFDPQTGRKHTKRRPALVLTNSRYNRASGLCVVCPVTSVRKGYPFEVPVSIDTVAGAVLGDQIKSLDWAARNAEFHSKAPADLLRKARTYVTVLLGLRG